MSDRRSPRPTLGSSAGLDDHAGGASARSRIATMTSPDEFLARVDPAKRADVAALHALIRKTLPTYTPAVYGAMLGYGAYHYRYASGREGESYRVAVSPNKSGISVYVNAVDVGGWLAEQASATLGKASVGKSCIRFKRLVDLDLAALTTLLRRVRTATTPGEVAPASAA